MKAIRFSTSDDGDPRIGALEGDTIRDAGPAGAAGFVPDERGWAAIADASGAEHALADVRVLHPVVPGKILAIGINYRTHARETGIEVPSVPVLFAKFPSALIGHGDDIVVPREETRPDYEGELAVVIGRRTYRADRAGARAAVGGISVMNDVSGRRAQMETPLRQFTLGKSYDTFAPMGPCIASADGVDLADVDVRTWVSGELRQEANTSDLIFAVEDLIVYLSAGTTLEPGDVIATGTPGGVGDWHDPPRYLREGDVVEIEVGGVGRLRNGVRMER